MLLWPQDFAKVGIGVVVSKFSPGRTDWRQSGWSKNRLSTINRGLQRALLSVQGLTGRRIITITTLTEDGKENCLAILAISKAEEKKE